MKVVRYPHPALRTVCKPLSALDESVRTQAARMLELMYKSDLGLAAPQVAIDYRMIVLNFEGDATKPELEVVAINPVIVETKGAEKDREGCLSFPDLYQDIRRHKTVKVKYYGLDGNLHEMTCSDLPARIWQHEIDHLDGTLFIDKMGPLARNSSKKYLENFIADFEEALKKGTIPPGTKPKL